MDFNQEKVEAIVRDPRESLDMEVKSWIDPTSPEGLAKIAKACIALRNNNGGYLLLGFDNDGRPNPAGQALNARELFHPDRVQEIVARYASYAFEVRVEFAWRDGIEYPVILVPSGVEPQLPH